MVCATVGGTTGKVLQYIIGIQRYLGSRITFYHTVAHSRLHSAHFHIIGAISSGLAPDLGAAGTET